MCTRRLLFVLCALPLTSACRTPAPVPPPLELPPPEPVEAPPPPPPRRSIDQPPDEASLQRLRTELLADAGVPRADEQLFPDDYSTHEGVFTFRGGPGRTGGAFGTIPEDPTELRVAWQVTTGQSRAPWFGGAGWTGQPVIVRWPAVMRHSMPKLGARRQHEGFVEVLQGSLDGSVHFIDLATGKRSRPPLVTGNPIKGSVSLDPRGYPLLFVGQGIPEKRPIGLRVFELIEHKEVFFLPGGDRDAPRRGWGAFDSSGLLNRATDSYVVGGENGLLYLLRLHTDFDPLALKLKVAPEVVRYRYRSEERRHFGIENSLSAYRNLAFFADNAGTLQAIDLRTMAPLWRFEAGDDTDATLALEVEDDVPRLYTGTEVDKTGPRGRSWLRRLNGLTGAVEWERPYACQGALVPRKVDAGLFGTPAPGFGEVANVVFFVLARCPGPANGLVLALDKRTGDEAWRVELPKYSWSSPTLLTTPAGRVYLLLGGIGGHLRLLEATTGREVAALKLVGDIEASPAVFEGRAVLGTRANRIYGVDIR